MCVWISRGNGISGNRRFENFPRIRRIRKRRGKEKGAAVGAEIDSKKRSPIAVFPQIKISPPARWWTNIGRTCLIIFLETDRCCVSNFTPRNNKILALSSPSWFRQRRSYIYGISDVCKSVLESFRIGLIYLKSIFFIVQIFFFFLIAILF